MKRKAVEHAIEFSLSDLEEETSGAATMTVEQFSADRRRILQIQRDDIRFSASRSPSETPSDTVFHDLSLLEPDLIGNAPNRSHTRTRRILLSVRSRCSLQMTRRCSLYVQDEPMKDWVPHQQEYLDELFWHEGRAGVSHVCPDCIVDAEGPRDLAKYRCKDCMTPHMFCGSCIIRKHIENPFHRIQVCTFTNSVVLLNLSFNC